MPRQELAFEIAEGIRIWMDERAFAVRSRYVYYDDIKITGIRSYNAPTGRGTKTTWVPDLWIKSETPYYY